MGSAGWSASWKGGDIGDWFARVRDYWFLANTLWCKANIHKSHGGSVIIFSSGNKKCNWFTILQHSSPSSSELFPAAAAPLTGHPSASRVPLARIPWNLAARRGCHSPWPASTFITCSCAAQAWAQGGKPILAQESQGPLPVPESLIPSPPAHGRLLRCQPLWGAARPCAFCWGRGFLPSSCCTTGKNEISSIYYYYYCPAWKLNRC